MTQDDLLYRFRLSPNGVWRVLRRHGLHTRARRYGLVTDYAAPPSPSGPSQRPSGTWTWTTLASWSSSIACIGRLQGTISQLGARRSFIRPAGPRPMAVWSGSGRHPGGVLEAGLCPLPHPQQTGLRLDLERYLRYHNTERADTGRWTNGRTPEAVLGKAKPWHAKQ